VNYKIGTALCKSRLCPNCQRVLAAKRRANFLDWFELNREALRPYFFYHMVLTVRHSAKDAVRNNLYTPDLLRYFAELRGTAATLSGSQQRARSAAWKSFVAGGSYSVEIKDGTDGSPHIHIHCLLIGRKQLWNAAKPSAFVKHIKPLWKQITGDSDNIFVEPVHYIDPVTKEKHHCHFGSNLHIAEAVAECEKYTIKANAEDLVHYSPEFLTDLLTFKNRYYSRFGCLSSNDPASKQFQKMEMLCTDYKDLDRIEREEASRLFNPETGELVTKDQTQLVATPFRNVVGKPGVLRLRDEHGALVPLQPGSPPLGGETCFELQSRQPHLVRWFQEHERAKAGMLLARSVTADYDGRLDIFSDTNS
jgi:hypothetical protein